jgi:hypothetical protein
MVPKICINNHKLIYCKLPLSIRKKSNCKICNETDFYDCELICLTCNLNVCPYCYVKINLNYKRQKKLIHKFDELCKKQNENGSFYLDSDPCIDINKFFQEMFNVKDLKKLSYEIQYNFHILIELCIDSDKKYEINIKKLIKYLLVENNELFLTIIKYIKEILIYYKSNITTQRICTIN